MGEEKINTCPSGNKYCHFQIVDGCKCVPKHNKTHCFINDFDCSLHNPENIRPIQINKNKMNEIEIKALEIIEKYDGVRASYLGHHLWAKDKKYSRLPQHYCLPATALLKRMERKGLVKQVYDMLHERFYWKVS